MVLEGCLRRKNAAAYEMSISRDAIVWSCIAQISQSKHDSTWQWILQQLEEGKNVQDVLDMAGGLWCEY